jgi:hypothetical protein
LAPKINQLNGSSYATFIPKFGVDLIKATQKIRVSMTTDFYHNMTFDLEMVPSMKFPPFSDNYTRCYIDVRHIKRENAEQK